MSYQLKFHLKLRLLFPKGRMIYVKVTQDSPGSKGLICHIKRTITFVLNRFRLKGILDVQIKYIVCSHGNRSKAQNGEVKIYLYLTWFKPISIGLNCGNTKRILHSRLVDIGLRRS